MESKIPPQQGLVETALYVADLEESERFYRNVLGFRPLTSGDRLRALQIRDQQVLLLFRQGASMKPIETDGGTIPPSDSRGTTHLAFAIRSETYRDWKDTLEKQSIEVLSEVQWERGGRSLYFRDPDGHLVELATPGVWEVY